MRIPRKDSRIYRGDSNKNYLNMVLQFVLCKILNTTVVTFKFLHFFMDSLIVFDQAFEESFTNRTIFIAAKGILKMISFWEVSGRIFETHSILSAISLESGSSSSILVTIFLEMGKEWYWCIGSAVNKVFSLPLFSPSSFLTFHWYFWLTNFLQCGFIIFFWVFTFKLL